MQQVMILLSQHCKYYAFVLLSFLLLQQSTLAQAPKETTQALSKPAKKGWLESATLTENGEIIINYSMKIDKKSDQLSYEDYLFDKDLNFKGVQPGKENKETKPDYKGAAYWAYAGGTNSFNINSQKLSLMKGEAIFSWDYKRQRYEMSRRLSFDKIKMRNGEDRYDGYAAFSYKDEAFIIASYDPGGKEVKEQFVALYADNNLNVKETPVTTGGNYSLVYFGSRNSGNFFVIMAPKNKMPDTKQYVYAEFTDKAELVKRTNFTSPSPNMMIMDYSEVNDDLYLVGGSVKGNDTFEDEFTDYAIIENPGMGITRQAQKYNDVIFKKDLDNFHLLKLKDGELEFAGTTPIKNFDDKVIAPPGQKKKHTYDGKSLYVSTFKVTASGEYLIGAQLMDKDFNLKTKSLLLKYKDIVGLYFDGKGQLKAQYAVEKMNDDTKSEIFDCRQSFVIAPDSKSAYWEIMEVKGSKGYASYWDAVADNISYTPHYFPRIAKIDLTTNSLSEFEVLAGGGKFLVYTKNGRVIDESTNTAFYIGHDDEFEKLWIGKYLFK